LHSASSAYFSAYVRTYAEHALKEAVGDRHLLALTVTPYLRTYHAPPLFLNKNVCLSTEAALESTDSEICTDPEGKEVTVAYCLFKTRLLKYQIIF
jgi:hypothetical protein